MGLISRMEQRAGAPARAGRRDAYAGTYGIGSHGGFAGAAVSRLTASLSNWSASVNADLDSALVILRARARQLAANNEYGKRFLSLVAKNVVGRNNPMLQVRAYKDGPAANGQKVLDKAANDAVEVAWLRWGRTCDITGLHKSFPSFCRMLVKAVARDGEVLVRKVRRSDLPFGMALQALEADRLDEMLNKVASNGNTVRQGVEIDQSGRPVAYWIKPSHPGENYGVHGTIAERVPAQEVLHLFLPERPEQVRGATWFHAVIQRNATIGRFEDAAVTAAEIGASKIAAIQRAEDAPGTGADQLADSRGPTGLPQISVEAGEMFELPPGYTLSSWNPEYPHANFESFLKACLGGLATGYDVARHNLTGDMTEVNYSSARIAEGDEHETWMILQDWLMPSLAMPVYEDWLALALLRGDIRFEISGKALPPEKFDKFLNASRFRGRRWQSVDPEKESSANKANLEMNTTSLTRIAAERGDDIEDIIDERKQEMEMLRAAGLAVQAIDAPSAPTDPSAADGNAKPPPAAAGKADDEDAKVLRTLMLALARQLTSPAAPQIHVAPHVTLGETRIDAHIATPAAPNVEVRNEIHEREQPAPVVNIQPAVVNVAPPEVTVELEAIMPAQSRVEITGMPARKTASVVERDRDGNLVSSTQLETDA